MTAPAAHETAIPTLTTDRLIVRGHRADDLDECASVWGDLKIVRHIGGRPSTRAEAWRRMLAYAGLWSFLGFGYWAVEEKASGRYVGDVGLGEFRRDITPSIDGAPEAGWTLARWAHGRGYAREAVTAALAWADKALSAPRIVAIIHPDNTPSIRLARACGFSEWMNTTMSGEPATLFERTAPGTSASA